MSYLIKIRPVGAELFYEDRRTDDRNIDERTDGPDEANSYFSKFCERA